ncbi:helix-turn-helix domain-containing protein [Nocardioides piscis]|uniref:DUF4115 domain-containing protein n=1 Tax=Nocardioides piscis TaxID=2714938 RepID=A0A6G7YHZ5_9ACTN|nr:RodZ domain-containing protein [Nocardioides piscis]QIK76237.1 DUF4115 domain-containing protein [Nocardioides piscis]
MGAAELFETDADDGSQSAGELLSLAPDAIEVRRNAGLAAAVGVVASALAIAYLARAVAGGGVLDALMAAAMGLLGGFWLLTFLDARTPLLVADAQGIRIRLGRTWRGLPWSAVQHVEHTPRRGLLRDGRLVVSAHNEERLVDELDRAGRRQVRIASRLYGAPFAVPLGLSTRVVGADDDELGIAIETVARQTSAVVVIDPDDAVGVDPGPEPEPDDQPHARMALRDPRPLIAVAIAKLAGLVPQRRETEAELEGETEGELEPEPIVASQTPSALRESAAGRRSEARLDASEPGPDAGESGGRELRRPGSVSLVEDTQLWGDRVRPISRQGDPVEPIVFDEFELEPAPDPVIGPELLAARTRLGLSVDQLAARTRIRPHVIESIEVDDFTPCGGDFYARGHLRTLARVLGTDVSPLLASFDERYAHAEIDPRRVFEAELATGANGSIRSTRGGPNWSLLVAVVMALVLCWSIARLVMDAPPELRGTTPVLNGSGGPGGVGSSTLGDPVPVSLDAIGGGAHVVVRDGSGAIVFKGNLAAGESKELDAAPPVRVQTTDGALEVALDGQEAKPVGQAGVTGQGTFVAR